MQRKAPAEPKGVECDNCGQTGGHLDENGNLRCGDCGRFATETEYYCQIHDIDYEALYPNDKHCPMCREEDRAAALQLERQARDRRVEPW